MTAKLLLWFTADYLNSGFYHEQDHSSLLDHIDSETSRKVSSVM